MAWYIEYDFKVFNVGKPRKALIALDCPDDFHARAEAVKQAKKDIKQFRLQKPILVWKEEIYRTKRRKPWQKEN